MTTEATTETIPGEMSAPPVVASTIPDSLPAVERIPDALLEICRDDIAEANANMELAFTYKAASEGITKRMQNRVTKALNLLPVDSFDLSTGIVTRGGAAKVEP